MLVSKVDRIPPSPQRFRATTQREFIEARDIAEAVQVMQRRFPHCIVTRDESMVDK